MKVFNKQFRLSLSIITVMLGLVFASCESELDKEPITQLTEDQVFEDPASYKQFLARVYAGIAVSGQQGPSGQPDISGIDEGFSNYLRQYWKHQELTTDEAIIAWKDGTIHDLHNHVWTPSNEFVRAMYDRIYFQVGLINQFLRETTPEKLDGRGVDATLKAEPSLGMRLGSFYLRLEKTTLDEVRRAALVGDIAHQGDAGQPEPGLELVDLSFQGFRVGGVAVEHLDGHRCSRG